MTSTLSDIIRTAREGAGITQEQAAERAEIPLRSWQALEQQQRRIPSDGDRWRRICEAVGLNPGEALREFHRKEGFCDG